MTCFCWPKRTGLCFYNRFRITVQVRAEDLRIKPKLMGRVLRVLHELRRSGKASSLLAIVCFVRLELPPGCELQYRLTSARTRGFSIKSLASVYSYVIAVAFRTPDFSTY